MSILARRERVLVTRWFHQGYFGSIQGSPDETLFDIVTDFLAVIGQHKLNLDCSEKAFRRSMCEAVCTMRMYGVDSWSGPHRFVRYPQEWTQELETLWQNWNNGRMFTPLFWTNFWGRHVVRDWEAGLDGWRSQMELILPLYIQRSMDLFVAQGLFVDDEDGGFTEVFDDGDV